MATPPPAPPVPPPAKRATRRRVRLAVIISLSVVLLGTAAVGVPFAVAYERATVDTMGAVAFERRLVIPPLDEGVMSNGRRSFELGIDEGATDFGFAEPTPTWGVNGDFLGPTLRMRRGEEVRMRVTNSLSEDTTLHWHGMHLPAVMDGGPHQMIESGRRWEPHWSVDQPAATLWYHPHLHDVTTEHVYRGVAGMIIVEDDNLAAADLPREYGVDDVPLIVQDKKFDAAGRLDTADGFLRLTGLLGNTVMANGTIGGFHDVTTERVRLRLLNGSTARVYNFGFADDRSFSLVATDGGLLAAPVATNRVQLTPGERAEIVVTMSPGEATVLRSYPPDLRSFAVQERFSGGDDAFDIVELRAAAKLRSSPDVPAVLAADPVADLDVADSAQTRYFQLQGVQINGNEMDMARIDTVVTARATETWEITNGDGYPHNFHLHDVGFRVLDIGGEPPAPESTGRKDTVFVPPGQTVRLLITFGAATDPNHPYMYHCHLLRHEDGGMMGQFVVVEPGGQAGVIDLGGHAHAAAP